jgi:hypothetical protein
MAKSMYFVIFILCLLNNINGFVFNTLFRHREKTNCIYLKKDDKAEFEKPIYILYGKSSNKDDQIIEDLNRTDLKYIFIELELDEFLLKLDDDNFNNEFLIIESSGENQKEISYSDMYNIISKNYLF